MTVLDAFAVLALLKDEPAAETVERIIRRDHTATLTALGVAEVLDHLVRLVGVDDENAALDLAQLGLTTPITVDERLATAAGLLRARQYHRKHRAISLADCVAAEAARSRSVPLATADPHLLDTCAVEGIQTVPLPDSSGAIWST